MAITIKQAEDWIAKMPNAGKRGWKKELRKSHTLLLKSQRKHFTKHMSPAGVPWERTVDNKYKIGDVGAIDVDTRPGSKMHGKKYVRRIRSGREKKLANKYRHGAQKALYRRGKKNKAVELFKGATKRNDSDHYWRLGNTYLRFGPKRKLHPGKHQYGQGDTPARPFYGVDQADAKKIGEIFHKGYLKRIEKMAPRP